MKRLFTLLTVLLFASSLYAQNDTTYWKKGGDFSLNFSQVSLSNWQAGGDNTISGNTFFNYSVDYAKGKNSWNNKLILGYGLQLIDGDYTKTDDKIDLSSMYGHAMNDKVDISVLAFFKTQFAEGFDGDNDSIYISKFMAPGYIGVGPGFNYKPVEYFSMFLSPATVQLVVVNDQRLADEGAFGVAPAEYMTMEDGTQVKTKDGEQIKYQLGANFKLAFKKDIMKNVNFETTLELFSDYLYNPENIIVKWDAILDLTVNKYLSAKLTTNLIYDDNINITDKDGNVGPRTQFKEIFGVGFGVKF
jgi:hypothetical protein